MLSSPSVQYCIYGTVPNLRASKQIVALRKKCTFFSNLDLAFDLKNNWHCRFLRSFHESSAAVDHHLLHQQLVSPAIERAVNALKFVAQHVKNEDNFEGVIWHILNCVFPANNNLGISLALEDFNT